jgi:ABC-type amino acid transport system permease subunit
MEDKSLLKTLLTWLVAGIVVVIALKVAFILLGVTMALVAILFRLLPILLAGWLAYLVIRWFRGNGSAPDPYV